MKTLALVILASTIAFLAGRTSGKADAECEIYSSGYDAAVSDMTK